MQDPMTPEAARERLAGARQRFFAAYAKVSATPGTRSDWQAVTAAEGELLASYRALIDAGHAPA